MTGLNLPAVLRFTSLDGPWSGPQPTLLDRAWNRWQVIKLAAILWDNASLANMQPAPGLQGLLLVLNRRTGGWNCVSWKFVSVCFLLLVPEMMNPAGASQHVTS